MTLVDPVECGLREGRGGTSRDISSSPPPTRRDVPPHWLTDAQRGEVEHRFEAEYLALARASWRRTVARAGELRAGHGEA
ncbi:hypothetical protein ACFWWT_20910 [Streptomyces sp. NPDC058676]|uniref:hypothetical protein n=1 Tax=unclassified Streptomyces TaxID=2593676 RepID=UPI0036486D7A